MEGGSGGAETGGATVEVAVSGTFEGAAVSPVTLGPVTLGAGSTASCDEEFEVLLLSAEASVGSVAAICVVWDLADSTAIDDVVDIKTKPRTARKRHRNIANPTTLMN